MIITRTPFRISFAGGGSDLKEFYANNGGSVVSVSINKYIYLSMHPYFKADKFFLKYSKNELVDGVDKIEHRIIKEVFREYNISGVDFNSSADIPAGTGLGSSSAFTAGIINLCNAYTNKYMCKEEIAKQASRMEIDILHEPIGKQDQYACAVGGLNYIQFNQDDTVTLEKIIMKKEALRQLQNNLLLFYLGDSRSASSILKEQKENTINDKAKVENLKKMVKLSNNLMYELNNNNVDIMGEILYTGWMYKKELASAISNNTIDTCYETAIKAGALGGKLLGAGGGGFLLFYIKDEFKPSVRKALNKLEEVAFEFDTIGTTVIYYD